MRISIKTGFCLLAVAAIIAAGCASHPKDFIPNGATVKLPPTDPANVKVLDSIPRGMVIGTVLVDRAKAQDTASIIAQARKQAAAQGADFIVWEDSLGTAPGATPEPGSPPASAQDIGTLGHTTAAVPESSLPEQTVEKIPKARFTAGIFIGGAPAAGQ
jgi:hypothetical protein